MKPGYKIIIAGLLVYGGIKITSVVSESPYKEFSMKFVKHLQKNRPFAAQELLSPQLQAKISIERLSTLAKDNNLTQLMSMSWTEVKEDEGSYTLHGDLIFADGQKVSAEFLVATPKEEIMIIKNFKIGNLELGNISSFLK